MKLYLLQKRYFNCMLDSDDLFIHQLNLEKLTTTGKVFSTQDNNQVIFGKNNSMNDTSQLKSTASVIIPPSLFTFIGATLNLSDVGIFFTIYTTASLFQIANVSNTTTVVPLIIGATVVGVKVENLTEPVKLNFTVPNNVSTFLSNHKGA